MKTLITILMTICAINCMGQDNQGATHTITSRYAVLLTEVVNS